jgi:hypothetical protein
LHTVTKKFADTKPNIVYSLLLFTKYYWDNQTKEDEDVMVEMRNTYLGWNA